MKLIKSAQLVRGAREVLTKTALGTFSNDDDANRVFEATFIAFNELVDDEPLVRPTSYEVADIVRPNVKAFLPILAMIFLGWAIQRLLDYLWDQYTKQAIERAVKAQAKKRPAKKPKR